MTVDEGTQSSVSLTVDRLSWPNWSVRKTFVGACRGSLFDARTL